MTDIVSTGAVTTLIQVVIIDLVLAGDNAVVIGLAAGSLPSEQRKRAILIGILAATAFRILGAGIATQMLQLFGLRLAGRCGATFTRHRTLNIQPARRQ